METPQEVGTLVSDFPVVDPEEGLLRGPGLRHVSHSGPWAFALKGVWVRTHGPGYSSKPHLPWNKRSVGSTLRSSLFVVSRRQVVK